MQETTAGSSLTKTAARGSTFVSHSSSAGSGISSFIPVTWGYVTLVESILVEVSSTSSLSLTYGRKAVLWIRSGFNADPDPAFYLIADPDADPDPGRQTNANRGGSRYES
jgi:hypothetical protein